MQQLLTSQHCKWTVGTVYTTSLLSTQCCIACRETFIYKYITVRIIGTILYTVCSILPTHAWSPAGTIAQVSCAPREWRCFHSTHRKIRNVHRLAFLVQAKGHLNEGHDHRPREIVGRRPTTSKLIFERLDNITVVSYACVLVVQLLLFSADVGASWYIYGMIYRRLIPHDAQR